MSIKTYLYTQMCLQRKTNHKIKKDRYSPVVFVVRIRLLAERQWMVKIPISIF